MMPATSETRDQLASGAAPEAPPRQGRDGAYWKAVAAAEAKCKALAVRWLRAVEAAVRGDDAAREREAAEAFRLADQLDLECEGIAGGGA